MDTNPKTPEQTLRERQQYVSGFNETMIKIWKDKMLLLDAIRTGRLYRSAMAVGMTADGKFTEITLSQSFRTYGVFVDAGTGSNTPIGNPGDIGRPNRRVKKPWFSKRYYSSVMRIREFLADNLGKEGCLVIAEALSASHLRASLRSAPDHSVF